MQTKTHLSSGERENIQSMLDARGSFRLIAHTLGRDPTTISKEVKSHIVFERKGAYGRPFNDCALRETCTLSMICRDIDHCRRSRCKFCTCVPCHTACGSYVKQSCPKHRLPPYVCNGCGDKPRCTLEKRLYRASAAQKEYEIIRSESRSGVCVDEDELARLNAIVSPLIKQGQSIHHVCSQHLDQIMHSEKTIYNYIGASLLDVRNVDLPRKVRYRPRKSKHSVLKIDKSCVLNRTYADFLQFMSVNPDLPIVEIDTVEGRKGGKVILTVHFTVSRLMLAFIRDANTAQSVQVIFDGIYKTLGRPLFMRLFPVILTDRGSEFSNPKAIEFDDVGERRTYVYYCDASNPNQKGACENNHELIRRIVAKGKPFDLFEQNDISLMMNHINSYGRLSLNDISPYKHFEMLYGKEPLDLLGLEYVDPNSIVLQPSLLNQH